MWPPSPDLNPMSNPKIPPGDMRTKKQTGCIFAHLREKERKKAAGDMRQKEHTAEVLH